MRNWKSRSIRAIFFVCCMALTVALPAGCGLKGNPVPYGVAQPLIVKDLEAGPSPAGNRLVWTLPGGGTGVAKVRILRSALDVQGGSCPGCPVEFNRIAEPVVEELSKAIGSGRVAFTDRGVKEGFLYNYRIVLCDGSGLCGTESNRATVDLKRSAEGAVKTGDDGVVKSVVPEK